ncbi:hypothetical protein EV702DRAFT_1042071 [Suillus placidus]|uniref:Uncharacterized protein n=1 Tax=Suillus placidus TaxID=48579 RepID=A0A9P7A346_9AGAM|nr:hypothetical protein EV702DRAFT_1042071 [Suillus placidus]
MSQKGKRLWFPYHRKRVCGHGFHCFALKGHTCINPQKHKPSTACRSSFVDLNACVTIKGYDITGSKHRNNVIFEEHGQGTLSYDRKLWQQYPLETATSDLQHKRAADTLQLNVVQ